MPNNSLTLLKNNFLIETSGELGFTSAKLFNSLFHFAYNDIHTKEIHSISYKELGDYLGYTNKIKLEGIRKGLDSLLGVRIFWDILDESSGEMIMGGTTLLGSYEFKDGVCEFGFPPHLRKKLLVDKLYTKINIRLQNKLSGKYSLKIYELAKEFYREQDGVGETRCIPLDKLKLFLGIPERSYPDFRIFKRAVLKPAIEEVTKYSDIVVTMVLEKQSRKVTGVKFKMGKKKDDEFDTKITKGKHSPIDPQPTPSNISPVAQSLIALNISSQKITQWQTAYTPEYLQSKIDLTYQYLRERKIKTSPSGFLVRAVEEDFGGKTIDIDTLLEQEALEARKINPETFSLSPIDFHTKEEFQARVEQLQSQYYNPRWSERDMTTAEEIWSLNLG